MIQNYEIKNPQLILKMIEELKNEAKEAQHNHQIEKKNLMNEINILKKKQNASNQQDNHWRQILMEEKNKEIYQLRDQIGKFQEIKIKYETMKENEGFQNYQQDQFQEREKKEKDIEIFRLQGQIEKLKGENLSDQRAYLKQIGDLKNENIMLRNKIDFLQNNILQKEQEINERELDKKIFYTQNVVKKEKMHIKNQVLFQSENIFLFLQDKFERERKLLMFQFWREKLRKKLSIKQEAKIERLTFNVRDIVLKISSLQKQLAQNLQDFLRKIFIQSFENSQKNQKNSVLSFTQELSKQINKNETLEMILQTYNEIYEIHIKCDLENTYKMNIENLDPSSLNSYNQDILSEMKQLHQIDEKIGKLCAPKITLFRLLQMMIKYENPVNRQKKLISEQILRIIKGML